MSEDKVLYLEFKEFREYEQLVSQTATMMFRGASCFTAEKLAPIRKMFAQQKYGADIIKLKEKEDKVETLKEAVKELKEEVAELKKEEVKKKTRTKKG